MPNRTSQLHSYEYQDYLDAWNRQAQGADTVTVFTPGNHILVGLLLRKLSLPSFCILRDELFAAYQSGQPRDSFEFIEMALLFNDPCSTPKEAEAVQG